MTRKVSAPAFRDASRTAISRLVGQEPMTGTVAPLAVTHADENSHAAYPDSLPWNALVASWVQLDISAPMRWTGANSNGEAVVGVAASAAIVGTVEVTMHQPITNGAKRPDLLRILTLHQARQLAQHLNEAADEAERADNLQLVANA